MSLRGVSDETGSLGSYCLSEESEEDTCGYG